MTNPTDLLRRALDMFERMSLDSNSFKVVTDISKLAYDLRTAIETGGWLPIDEKAKNGTWWLCLHKSGHRNIMQFCSDNFWRTDCNSTYISWDPIGYMPLPPPPNSPNRESE